MYQIDQEINHIKDSVLDMMVMVRKQIERSKEALLTNNKDITEQIIAKEKKVNAIDLKIDSDCEKVLALMSPVADDLRFLIAVLNINTFLERIGDNAESIANFINEFDEAVNNNVIKKLQLEEMFDFCLEMFDVISEAFDEEDTDLAAKVFKKDKAVDEVNNAAIARVSELIRSDINNTENYLKYLSVIRKLERVGDLVKNVAEETVFYVDAKVLKHKKKKKLKIIERDK